MWPRQPRSESLTHFRRSGVFCRCVFSLFRARWLVLRRSVAPVAWCLPEAVRSHSVQLRCTSAVTVHQCSYGTQPSFFVTALSAVTLHNPHFFQLHSPPFFRKCTQCSYSNPPPFFVTSLSAVTCQIMSNSSSGEDVALWPRQPRFESLIGQHLQFFF